MRAARATLFAALAALLHACSAPSSSGPSSTASASASAPAASATGAASLVVASVSTGPSVGPSASGAPSANERGAPGVACPLDMRLVAGDYCPAVEQVCTSYSPPDPDAAAAEHALGVVEKSQCRRFASPSRCLSPKREPMRFCMDTYEWPNRPGVIPRNLTSWQEAKDRCEGIGKRLCTDVEFTFACEGEEMRPHVTGFDRDPKKCWFDRKYRLRTYDFPKHDACLADFACRLALFVVDQRVETGKMAECVSPEGVHDLNGNVNEWVALPNKGFSKRAGLKGGWWGPVRDRCRPITTFHGESDYGYEVGFRCCKDAASGG
ncbi:MAG: SUMF1/EgtB/PvdO family nonheme iron enzyme [Polyangiaceae bacterium]